MNLLYFLWRLEERTLYITDGISRGRQIATRSCAAHPGRAERALKAPSTRSRFALLVPGGVTALVHVFGALADARGVIASYKMPGTPVGTARASAPPTPDYS
jgi:hypothetical protein